MLARRGTCAGCALGTVPVAYQHKQQSSDHEIVTAAEKHRGQLATLASAVGTGS